MGTQAGKKIAIVIYANPDDLPPTFNAVSLLAKHYQILVIGRNIGAPHRGYPAHVQVHRLGQFSDFNSRLKRSAWAKLSEFANFISQCRALLHDADLILAYDEYGHIAAQRSKPKTSTPVLFQSHELSAKSLAFWRLSTWVGWLHAHAIHRAQAVIYPDAVRAQFAQQHYGLRQLPLVVPNFPRLDSVVLKANWTDAIAQRWHAPRLLYRGSISTLSAMCESVAALAQARAQLPALCIEFVGFLTKSSQLELEQAVRQLDLSSAYRYLGVLPYDALQAPTETAAIGLAMYTNTQFDRVACAQASNKIYEYAACGLPVIVSDFTTYRDFLGQESWVFFADPSAPESIAKAILDILSDAVRYRELCVAARQAFEQRFHYELAFAPLQQAIVSLLAN